LLLLLPLQAQTAMRLVGCRILPHYMPLTLSYVALLPLPLLLLLLLQAQTANP
jgi:hypothetical protein